ncbi:hypothetical protein ACYSNN_00580 [Peptoniphilus genitalis]
MEKIEACGGKAEVI